MRHVSRESIPIKHFLSFLYSHPKLFKQQKLADQDGILKTKHVISPQKLPPLKRLLSLQAPQRLVFHRRHQAALVDKQPVGEAVRTHSFASQAVSMEEQQPEMWSEAGQEEASLPAEPARACAAWPAAAAFLLWLSELNIKFPDS